MKLHILGVCGTFMGGIALLAKQLGHEVSGSDSNVYPPMSTQLEASGIRLMEGYAAAHLKPPPDLVIVGNALSRGNRAVEYLLDEGLPFVSGPQWLAEQALRGRWALAVAGTHGKTTTTSMLAWILESAGLAPGFLIGGVAQNFGVSARLGQGPHFVVEADEYDTAFFDKRSKFIHYRPRTLIINNIEFDHADIFPDLEAVKRQFHHLVRTVPGNGLIVRPAPDAAIDAVLGMGCWTAQQSFGENHNARWQIRALSPDYSQFEVLTDQELQGTVRWSCFGRHNALNAVAAMAAARHAGVSAEAACQGLADFKNAKRRLESLGTVAGVTVYDDFAHHPTAIAVTIDALRQRVGREARIITVFEPRSNTMRMGVHREELAPAFAGADLALFYRPPELGWDLSQATETLGERRQVFPDLDGIIDSILSRKRPGDHILIMSNGGFGGIHGKLLAILART
jgi:UDP-N-acetylmuramate: L-alanyl-gamma-D-glutamyl-meso-diaminopimelate ligase